MKSVNVESVVYNLVFLPQTHLFRLLINSKNFALSRGLHVQPRRRSVAMALPSRGHTRAAIGIRTHDCSAPAIQNSRLACTRRAANARLIIISKLLHSALILTSKYFMSCSLYLWGFLLWFFTLIKDQRLPIASKYLVQLSCKIVFAHFRDCVPQNNRQRLLNRFVRNFKNEIIATRWSTSMD